jgi:hypothetical protein
VLPVAAVGHAHMRGAVAAAEAAYSARALGGLLHLALRARSLATLDLLLGLAGHGCARLRAQCTGRLWACVGGEELDAF